MDVAPIIFLGGAVILLWIAQWLRMNKPQPPLESDEVEQVLREIPITSEGDAILVSREHGQVIYANGPARHLLAINGGEPHLEVIASHAQPSENFLGLFAEETQASFQLGNRWVEASSHRIPAGPELRTVVIMRELSADGQASGGSLDLSRAFRLINLIGDTVDTTLGIEQTLQSLLGLLRAELRYDSGEINIRDDITGNFVPRGWVGDASYLVELSLAGGVYRPDEGFTGWIARHRQPLLLTTRSELDTIQPKISKNPYRSFLGVPLVLGDTLMGTIEFGSLQEHHFSQGELSLMQALSKPIAVAIYNASLYADQVRRIEDITTLQQAIEQHAEVEQSEKVFAVLNERIAKLSNAEMSGIFLYDEARRGLVPALPFYGLPEAIVRSLFIPMPIDSPQRDIWETQSYWISNDVADEPLVEALGLSPIVNVAGIRSTAWLPLQVSAKTRIGVMAVSNKRGEGFTPRDIQNLRALASQATVVVENIQLYGREKSMDAQLAGLQEITYAIGALTEEGEFFSELTQRIAKLMNVQTCGFMLYEEGAKRLMSRLPFYGIEDDAIRDYQITLKSGTIFDELWTEEDSWFSNRVQNDPLTFEAGLDQLAVQLGVQKTLFAVLSTGGRRIGVVQVSNKLNGQDFNDADARLLLIFATQAATIMENARLFQEVQRNSEQAQRLRSIAEKAGKISTNEDALADLLQEIANFTQSSVVFINVLSQPGSLVTYPRWVYGTELTEPIVQDTSAQGFEHSVVRSRRPFISNDIANEQLILASYRQLSQRFDLHRVLVVPLFVGDRSLGEMGVANREGGYTESDLSNLGAIAAQVAAAFDRLLQYQATGQNLTRRMEELDAISRVSNELTLTLDFDQILNLIRSETIKATGATGCTVALLYPNTRWERPDAPELERRLGAVRTMDRLADLEIEAIHRGASSVIVPDYSESEYKPLPRDARSGLAASILYVDQTVGVLHVYHTEANRFDEYAATFITTMATKASLGYGNAIRFQEQMERSERLRRRVEQLNRIFELSHMLPSNTEPILVLEAVAFSIQQAVGFDSVVMLLSDETEGVMKRVAQSGLPLEVFEKSKANTVPLKALNLILKDKYRISESYFFPIHEVTQWYSESVVALSTAFAGNRTIAYSGMDQWHDGDMLLVTITGSTGKLLGLISLDRPHDNLRPDRTTIEVLEIFAHQASTTLENARLYQETIRSAEREARLNEVAEAVASTLDITRIVEAVAQGALRLLPFNRLSLALVDSEQRGFDLVRANVRNGNQLDIHRENRSNLAQTALGRSYFDRQEYVYRASDDLGREFEDLREWHDQGEKIGLVVGLVTGGESIGAMHIGSDRADTANFVDYVPLMRRMAQLVAASVQNARLFNQAVTLQILNESVVESIQQGIIVLDNSGRVISINDFMRSRYGWDDRALGQDLFANRPELQQLLSREIRTVLEQGIPQERVNQMSYDMDESLLVRNFYIYPLRNEGVVRGAVMLVEDVTERAKLEEAMEQRANQLAALTQVSSRITSSLEREEVIQLAIEEMNYLLKYRTITHWRRNGSYMVLEGYSGGSLHSVENVRIRISDFERVRQLVDGQRVIVINANQPQEENLPGEDNVHSWMGVPLVNQGHVVGMFALTQPHPNAYDSKSDQNIAFAFASQVAIALANADLFQQTFDRTNELGTLLEAAQATSDTQDINLIFRTVSELMLSALEMDQCTIFIWDEVDNYVEVQIDVNRRGDQARVQPKGTQHTLIHHSARLYALQHREVIVIAHDDQETPYSDEMNELLTRGDAAWMLVPLVTRDGSIGLIQLEQHVIDGRSMTQQKVRLAKALGSQVAVAIQNARLTTEMSAMFNEALVINDLSRAISSKLNLDEMLSIVREQVPRVTGSDEVYLALYNSETQTIEFPLAVRGNETYTIPPRQFGTDEVSFIIKHGRYLSLGADYFSLNDLRRSLGITNGEGDAKSYLGVPLKAGDKTFGVLALRDNERTRAFTINEQRILETVGSQLGAAIQNAQLFDQINKFAVELNTLVEERTIQLEEERDRLDTLYQITAELSRTLDMERLQQQAIGMVAKAVNGEDGLIMGLDPLTDSLYIQAYLNPNYVYTNDEGRIAHPAEQIGEWLLANEEPSVVIEDLSQFDAWDMSIPNADRWQSALAVVLESNQSDQQGVMVLLSSKYNAFSESELRLLVAAANQVASSINNAELYHLIRDQAERLGNLLRAEQEEAEKNSAILESITDGVVLSDAQGKIILFNSAAERILQLPREQVLEQSISKFAGLYGAGGSEWARLIQSQADLSDMEMRDGFSQDQMQLGDKIVNVQIAPVYTGEKLLGMLSVFRDITRDVEVDRLKSEFVSNVSHEFRTPLTPIKGYTDLLLMNALGELNDMQKRTLTTIKENVDRLTVLVEDVLDISTIDSGKQRLKLDMINVGDTLNSVISNLRSRPQHQRKNHTITIEVGENLPPIHADLDKINRILSNVIDNAFNYTPSGGKIDIRANLQADGKQILLVVEDSGVGIPEEFHEDIWKRFQRYEEHALKMDVAGTGLGLSIVREMVEMHHGEVWFESEVGKGTKFMIELPLEQPDSALTRTSTGLMRQVKPD